MNTSFSLMESVMVILGASLLTVVMAVFARTKRDTLLVLFAALILLIVLSFILPVK